MKVLLFSSHGTPTYTKEMGEILNKKKRPYNRIDEIIDYVENNVDNIESMPLTEAIKYVEDNKGKIFKMFGKQKNEEQFYHTWNKELKYVGYFSIIDVDTNRPWTIAEYDGSEYIQYLDFYCFYQ